MAYTEEQIDMLREGRVSELAIQLLREGYARRLCEERHFLRYKSPARNLESLKPCAECLRAAAEMYPHPKETQPREFTSPHTECVYRIVSIDGENVLQSKKLNRENIFTNMETITPAWIDRAKNAAAHWAGLVELAVHSTEEI